MKEAAAAKKQAEKEAKSERRRVKQLESSLQEQGELFEVAISDLQHKEQTLLAQVIIPYTSTCAIAHCSQSHYR